MSSHVTPFLILNLGSEMLFVIAQRLDAQQVPIDKATLVIDEITAAFISQETVSKLFEPSPPYTHLAVRQILENVAHSSAMQLDKYSMDRLWDLVTMIFKWQTAMTENIISVTRKHLAELTPFASNPQTALALERTQLNFESFVEKLTDADIQQIRNFLLAWLSVFRVRVSILLKLGLQNEDGSFCTEHSDEKCVYMLRDLGTNIYAVQKKDSRRNSAPSQEITTFVSQILGDKKMNHNFINLNISKQNTCIESDEKIPSQMYTEINLSAQKPQIDDTLTDLSIIKDNIDSSSMTDDLLEMLNNEF